MPSGHRTHQDSRDGSTGGVEAGESETSVCVRTHLPARADDRPSQQVAISAGDEFDEDAHYRTIGVNHAPADLTTPVQPEDNALSAPRGDSDLSFPRCADVGGVVGTIAE